ncbi:unnamed protein product [Camellia sinensis]
MDEPTTGLDARAAAIVMRAVKNVAETGRTIVCTIHQPSIDIFEAFGEAISGVQMIRNNYNPTTWTLEITSRSAEAQLCIDFVQVYKNSVCIIQILPLETAPVLLEKKINSQQGVTVEVSYLLVQAIAFVIITYSMIGYYWSTLAAILQSALHNVEPVLWRSDSSTV